MWKYNFTPDTNELYHWGVKGMTWGKHKYKKVVNGEYVYDDDSNFGSASSNVSGPRFDIKDLAGKYAMKKASGAANKANDEIDRAKNKLDLAGEYARRKVSGASNKIGDMALDYAGKKISGAANKVGDEIDRTKNKLDLAGEYARRKVSGASNKIGDMALDYAGKKISGAGTKVKNFFTNADEKKEVKELIPKYKQTLTKQQNELKQYQKERDQLKEALKFPNSSLEVHTIEVAIKANEKRIDELLADINHTIEEMHELQNLYPDD